MTREIFVNLPVEDLGRAAAFYEALGARRDPRCADATAIGLRFSDAIYVMLLTRARFADFTPRPVADATSATEVLLCLSEDSRVAVDAAVERGASAGGAADPAPRQDHGFMYGRSVADPDGHIWEVMWMDPSKLPAEGQSWSDITEKEIT